MPTVIAILDDENDRIQAMLPLIRDLFPNSHVETFENAPDMIAWLAENLALCTLICLDHDLGPNQIRNGRAFDPGTGRDVADYLASVQPVCPVIIHTTNAMAAPGMELALQDAEWQCSRVVPYGDIAWIRESWIEEVQRILT